MSYIIKQFEVESFRGESDVRLRFFKDINFIIGQNGTGKTTLMNLIAAIIENNPITLWRVPFRRAVLVFVQVSSGKEIHLSVDKNSKPASGRPEITMKYSAEDQEFEVDFDYTGEGRFVRYEDIAFSLSGSQHKKSIQAIRKLVSEAILFDWLPVTRDKTRDSAGGRWTDIEDVSDPLDRKIRQIVVDLTKYLSSLDKQASDILAEYQQEYFISLLDYQSPKNLTDVEIKNLFQNITSIFREFNMPESRYKRRLDAHFNRLVDQDGSNLGSDWENLLRDTFRLADLSRRWKNFEARRSKNYEPKRQFMDIFNSIFLHKKLSFDARNQPVVSSTKKNDFVIGLDALSSGEKQMLIILGEVLLQEQRSFIFLADEPELSLHINWQKDLVSNIRILNPNCQIIFATHSPDIVERFGERTHDLTKFS